ncbi:PspC domain-containing protein [Polaribacter glomeratus]|uniref:Transcriptional regulator n=1 Tax=Polaribacter glomeratus TaxID=102 RepID=A0A2S7WXS5_9FLAO|nr:PspC domain-containing protein [Polaribacter glomeratus]PQJ82380.1 transcriptional regulator [Polaribacter glomeratus]TXD64519.1 PspC domain-containing protein [Polaribacter glomeratus]
MNKTININLGGFFFHIDEEAYQKLRRYLESISKSLSDDPQGKNEIIADIEARISELLSEKITDARQVVNESDIDDIIKIMGQPEDYAEPEESYNESSYSYNRNSASGKKLFRDGDDKFLGGVASGIAHYFDIDTIWVRLGLLALFFGAGFGFLIYIILWVLLPEAKTTAEKLQMEGEPVNIDNIEKKIRKEFNNVSENVSEFANKASEKIKDGASEFSEKMNQTFSGKTKKNNGIQDLFETLGKIILAIFKVIGKFIGVIIIFVSAAVILSLIIGGFSVGSLEWLNVDGQFLQYPPFFYDAALPKWLLVLSVFLLIGIPFLILFILGLRILSSSVRKLSRPASLTLLGVWILALLAMIFTGLEYGTSYANYGHSTKKNTLNIAKNDTLTIKMINDDTIYYRHNLRRNSSQEEVEIDGKMMTYSNDIKVDVKRSATDESYVIIQRESRGKNKSNASKNAQNIKYKYEIIDNTIVLDAYFLSAYKNMWKDEEINVTIYVVENAIVYFDNSTKNFLDDVDNETEIYDKEMVNHYFLVTESTLKCTDCVAEIEEEKDVIEKKINNKIDNSSDKRLEETI